MMKKKIFMRGLLGFPIGIAIGYIITILISLIFAKGYYLSCSPALISAMENEISAVIFQAALSGILGAGFAAASVIWEIEDWSVVKQTGIYFLIVSLVALPIAYFAYWMEHSIVGFLSYFSVFILIFIIIWIIYFLIAGYNVKRMNEKLGETKRNMGI